MTTELCVEAISFELRQRRQWVAHLNKQPMDVKTGKPASTTDPSGWGCFAEASAARRSFDLDGIGFVFHEDDPFVGIDLDKCVDPITFEVAPWAMEIVERFDSYTEISPSGTGLHLIVRGALPGEGKGRKRNGIEIYDHARFFTITGHPLPRTQSEITRNRLVLAALYEQLAPPEVIAAPRPAVALTMDDHSLLDLARRARNGAKFSRLESGDSSDNAGDESAADLAFVSMLTFYTQDEAQLDRIFRQSGRYREKWERADYRARTFEKALQRTTFYEPKQMGYGAPTESRSYNVIPTPEPERHSPDATEACVVELARIAELEQALAAEREKRIAAEQRNQTLMQTINNPTWTPAQAIAYLRAQCEYDSKVERGDMPYGEWQDINLTELSKGVPLLDPDTGQPLKDADGTPKLQTSMTKKTISAALKTVAATAGVIELRDRTDDRGRTRLQMRALRSTPLETMRAHAEVFVQQSRARGRQKPKDPRLATIAPCPVCGPDADVVILSDAYCGSCDQHLGALPKERIAAPFQNETVNPAANVVAVLPTDVKTKRTPGRRPKQWESNDFDASDIDPEFFASTSPVQTETVADLAPLASIEERRSVRDGRCRICRTAALLTAESTERGTCTSCERQQVAGIVRQANAAFAEDATLGIDSPARAASEIELERFLRQTGLAGGD